MLPKIYEKYRFEAKEITVNIMVSPTFKTSENHYVK
jgi:hypothetical protein